MTKTIFQIQVVFAIFLSFTFCSHAALIRESGSMIVEDTESGLFWYYAPGPIPDFTGNSELITEASTSFAIAEEKVHNFYVDDNGLRWQDWELATYHELRLYLQQVNITNSIPFMGLDHASTLPYIDGRYDINDSLGGPPAWEILRILNAEAYTINFNSITYEPTDQVGAFIVSTSRPEPVPEPSTVLLFTLGLAGIFKRSRYKACPSFKPHPACLYLL